MRILFTRELGSTAHAGLERFDVEVHGGDVPMPKDVLLDRIRDADGLVCFPYDTIDADVISAARRLKVISTYSVGYDHIDVDAAARRGIMVGYTPGVLDDATADLTLALMLDVMRRVSEGDRTIRGGRWQEVYGAYDYVGTDLGSKTLGILGMGRIGRAVARRAAAFGMNVTYYNRRRLQANVEDSLSATFVDMNVLISGSDVVSLHLPYNAGTHGMINRHTFEMMKKEAFLINTARGRIVNESDLEQALLSGSIAGAALDVFESEPLAGSSRLLAMDNVVLAPHIGSSTIETRKRMEHIAIKNLILGLEGRRMLHGVGDQMHHDKP